MHDTYYEIAGIVIKISSPFTFYAVNGEAFRREAAEPDYCFRFEQTDDIPKLLRDTRKVGETLWSHEYQREDGSFLRAFLWQDKFYTEISALGKHEGICWYANEDILMERAREGFELLMYLCLEQIFIRFGALVLHSSHIKIKDKGLVFSAPSQTGKSTQAELWRKYADAKIINGDRSVLRKISGKWQVCGCPMCGTSGIHLQSMEPLTNIVMLSQSQENIANRLIVREAFRMIYPQITVAYWDLSYITHALDLLNDLCLEVPVWHYACTKETSAVFVLRKVLEL